MHAGLDRHKAPFEPAWPSCISQRDHSDTFAVAVDRRRDLDTIRIPDATGLETASAHHRDPCLDDDVSVGRMDAVRDRRGNVDQKTWHFHHPAIAIGQMPAR